MDFLFIFVFFSSSFVLGSLKLGLLEDQVTLIYFTIDFIGTQKNGEKSLGWGVLGLGSCRSSRRCLSKKLK